MASNKIFKIKVTSWFEHNPNAKKTFKKTMVQHKIIHDAALNSLPSSHRWLFFALIMICGEAANDTVTVTERQVNDILSSRIGAENALSQLQELQLVTFEKIESFRIKRIKRIKEIKELKEKNSHDVGKPELSDREENKKIKSAYVDAFRLRYGIEPPTQNAQFNSQVSSLRKKLGIDEAIEVVKFYLTHNDSWYLKNTHSFGYCLRDAETLRTQMLKGKAITMNDVKRFEKSMEQRKIIDDANDGGF